MITVLKFEAEWCGPCQILKPIWNELKNDLNNKFIFQEVDIDNNPQLRADYFIRSIPAIVLVKDGKEIARMQGLKTLNEIKEWLLNEQRNI